MVSLPITKFPLTDYQHEYLVGLAERQLFRTSSLHMADSLRCAHPHGEGSDHSLPPPNRNT